MCTNTPDLFKNHHQELVDHATIKREKVMAICNWSKTKFYEMLKNSDAISSAEKILIAQIYRVPISTLFADMKDFDINDDQPSDGNNNKKHISKRRKITRAKKSNDIPKDSTGNQ